MSTPDKKRVVPQKTLDLGYEFQYPDLEEALRHLLHKLLSHIF
jgi:NAD dependent epimerase/dehydratase family enzyme